MQDTRYKMQDAGWGATLSASPSQAGYRMGDIFPLPNLRERVRVRGYLKLQINRARMALLQAIKEVDSRLQLRE
jgi:hypothetical protein